MKNENKDLDKFMELAQPVLPMAYNLLYKEFNNKYITEDILQTALERAYKGFGGYRGEASFKNWFFAIIKNIKYDEYREIRKRKRTMAIEDVFSNSEENIAAVDWFHHSFNDDIDHVTLRDNINHILSYLPSADRELINKIFFEDKSTKLIAEEFGQTEEHVRVRKQRALDKLKVILFIDRYEEDLSKEAPSVYLDFLKEGLSKNEKILTVEILMNKVSFEELAERTKTDPDVLRIRYLRVLNKLSDFIRRNRDE